MRPTNSTDQKGKDAVSVIMRNWQLILAIAEKKTVLESVEAGWWQRTIPTDQTKWETNSLNCKEDR